MESKLSNGLAQPSNAQLAAASGDSQLIGNGFNQYHYHMIPVGIGKNGLIYKEFNDISCFLEREYLDALDIPEEWLKRMMAIMEQEMKVGLSQEGHLKQTPLQMENTYVSDRLNGTEHGSYLAIDLGGTRFRVHYIQIDNNKITADTTPYPLTKEIVYGPGQELFRYIAKCLNAFIEEKGLKSICNSLTLGFCFSFPIIQQALDSGLLLTWTKDFKCPGVEGQDVVAMLTEALRELNLDIKVSAILNDSTGTLIAGSLVDPNCCMSVIIGTGSNAAYLEKVDNIGTWQGCENEKNNKFSVIDMEWGAFGDNGVLDFLKTPYDFQVDKLTKHPGSFTFEKLFSGLYLGEVFRVILSAAHTNGHILKSYKNPKCNNQETCQQVVDGPNCPIVEIVNGNGGSPTKATDIDQVSLDIYKPWSIPTKYVSAIEEEAANKSSDVYAIGKKLMEFLKESHLLNHANEEDIYFIKQLSAHLLARAAKLIAAAIATVVKKMNRKNSGIAIDGSMYKLVPRLDRMIRDWVTRLLPPENNNVRIFLSEDGSGKGAALVAAISDRLPLNKSKHINERRTSLTPETDMYKIEQLIPHNDTYRSRKD